MPGKLQFLTFKEAAKLGDYDDMPMLTDDRDTQMYLSTNSVQQPFHLVCEKDTLIIQMSGSGRLEFKDGAIRYYDVEVGDFIYVPGGVPTRYTPASTSVQYRLRAQDAGAEGAIFYSEKSDAELYRHMWDTAEIPIQQGYIDACSAYNADPELRTCPVTGELHPPIDLAPFGWSDVLEKLSPADGVN